MESIEISVYPFVQVSNLYQQALKLGEECGEVMGEFYAGDLKETATHEDLLSIAYECGDVIQAAVNMIVLLGENPNDIMRSTTIKNNSRGYYAQ